MLPAHWSTQSCVQMYRRQLGKCRQGVMNSPSRNPTAVVWPSGAPGAGSSGGTAWAPENIPAHPLLCVAGLGGFSRLFRLFLTVKIRLQRKASGG